MQNTRRLILGLALAGLLSSLVGEPAVAPDTVIGRLELHEEVYEVGDHGLLTLNGPPGLVPMLYVSFDPEPLLTSRFKPGRYEPLEEHGFLVLKSRKVECDVPDKYFQVGFLDPETHQRVGISNQVFLRIDRSACEH